MEVQTFHAYFLRGKSLKHPTLYQVETIYKKMVYGWKQVIYVEIYFKTLWEYESMKGLYLHRMTVYDALVTIKKTKTFLKKFLFFFKKVVVFFEKFLIFFESMRISHM